MLDVTQSVALFLVVLVFVIVKPRGLSIGWSAVGGGILALLLGLVSWINVLTVIGIVWDATLTFVAIIVISVILEDVGFFRWAAFHMIRAARGDGRRLFWLLGILAALVTMFFTNDGAALILTPIIYEQTVALGLPRRTGLALVMAGGFLADTTSVPLSTSNLVNILSSDFFHLGFLGYALRMLPVDVVAFLASMTVLWLFYRRDLPQNVATGTVERPQDAIADPMVFRLGLVVLALLVVGYAASQFLHWPVSVFAGSAALALLILARRSPVIRVRTVVQGAPWRIVAFLVGMYVVVYGLRNAGLIDILSRVLSGLAAHGTLAAVFGTGFVAAGLSAIMNNMPTVMIDALAIEHAAAPHLHQTLMAYANVVGSDLGPKLTPIGSLATLLWLDRLERRGLAIGWGYYMKMGVLLTLPVLAVTLFGLWGASAILHRAGFGP